MVTGVFLGELLTYLDRSQPLPLSLLAALWAYIVLAPVVPFAILRTVPSTRRVGVSSGGLVVDTGIRRRLYPWGSLYQVVRSYERRYRPGKVQARFRTRIILGPDRLGLHLALTPDQGDQLARYLRLE